MKILLIDDHYLIGKSLELTLTTYPSIHAFKHLIDPSLAIETIACYQPDLVLMDIHMGAINGINLGKEILQTFPIKLVFLSGFDLLEYHDQTQKIGAYGFFDKSCSIDWLVAQLEKIHFHHEKIFPLKNTDAMLPSLSPREREILQRLAQGEKQTAIAQELAISERTVRNHLYTINNKLGTTSALTSVVKAIELGVVQVRVQ